MFLTRLNQKALDECQLDPKCPTIVGVSGGADSLALMHGLTALEYSIVVAHLDHAIRPDSISDAKQVRRWAEEYHLPFVMERIDVRQTADAEGLSLEEAARKVRYRFLFRLARRYSAQAVAVAHHADDQVETVLMHFLRGAGLSGLGGMDYWRIMPVWDAKIPLVRPLLGHWRSEIEAYVARSGLIPCEDETNQDETYFRNRLRHSLIPSLESYNPRIRKIIWRMADVLGEEDQLLSDLAQSAWTQCLLALTPDLIQLDLGCFTGYEKALQRRILRRAVIHLRPELRDFGFEAIERGLAFISAPSSSRQVQLAGRLDLALVSGRILLAKRSSEWPDFGKPQLPTIDFCAPLPIPGALGWDGWQIRSQRLIDLPQDAPWQTKDAAHFEAWFDAANFPDTLTVRGRQDGDRWQPFGLEGHSQKIKDFLINEKIPAHLRDKWPLVCGFDEILWVAGIRQSNFHRITDATQEIIHLLLSKNES